MIVKKLLRLEENVVKEIDDLVEEKSKTEFTTWSAMVRNLIRLGLDKMKGGKKMINKGNWLYDPETHKITYNPHPLLSDYSMNLTKSCALKYLHDTGKLGWIGEEDMDHLVDLFGAVKLQYPWLPAFTNKVPKYIMKKFNVEE